MATVSGGIKINNAVNAQVTVSSGATANVYTAPANGYAIVQIYAFDSLNGYATIKVSGKPVYFINGRPPGAPNYSVSAPDYTGTGTIIVYVGPSQTLSVQEGSGFHAVTVYVTGVEFANS